MSLFCTHAGVWWSVSESRVCQSFMKSIPTSQVSFGRGVGQEGRSSGVKDNRIGWPVWVHYTVTQYLHFLSFLSLSTAVGLNEDLQTQLSSIWGPYWQDNFGILRLLPMDTKIPLMSDNTWSVQVNPPLLSKGVCSSFLFSPTFSLWILKDEALWIPLLDGKSRERVWLRATFSLLCLCTPIAFPSAGGDGRWDSFLHSTAWVIMLCHTLFPWHSNGYFLQNEEKDIFLKLLGFVGEWANAFGHHLIWSHQSFYQPVWPYQRS